MVWSVSKVRRRLGIPRDEVVLAWAPADERGMRVPCPPTAAVRRHRPYVALTDAALWRGRGGIAWRGGLEDVVLASVVGASDGAPAGMSDGASEGVPDGALRIDLVRGDPLVLPVVDGGTFQDHLVREIRAFDRDLHRTAVHRVGLVGLPPGMQKGARRGAVHPSGQAAGPDAGPVAERVPLHDPAGPDDVRLLLHEAELIVLRELRRVLTGARSSTGWPGR